MSYAGLTASKGYIHIGHHMVHVEFLRDHTAAEIAYLTGVPEHWLLEQAMGAWIPLELPWEEHDG